MDRAAYLTMQQLEETHWWFVARRSILSGALAALKLPAKARILEVGCGSGGNVRMLQGFGELTAMEPDAPSRAYIREKFGIEPLASALPDGAPTVAKPFDLVCAFDIIEHVEQDAEALAALRPMVSPDGYLVVSVPAYGWMWSAHDVRHHHKRRYTRSAFVRLLEGAGYEVVRATYFNTLLFPLAVAVRFAKRLLRSRVEDDAMPSPFANRVLRGLFASEAAWLKRAGLPFGLSLMLVARPRAAWA